MARPPLPSPLLRTILPILPFLFLLTTPIQAQAPSANINTTNTTTPSLSTSPDASGKYTISAPGIRAQFVPYGASISNLFLNDSTGIERDVVVGFENASYYSQDGQHGHWGAVPGRYANRIANSTFSLPADPTDPSSESTTTYHIPSNENLSPAAAAAGGPDTLHGGPDGWDHRNFTVVSASSASVTFALFDPAGAQGFPGDVQAYVTYSVEEGGLWRIRMVAVSLSELTPIMLSSHTYWNLDGFANPNTPTILNHTLHLPYSGQRVGVDGNLIPDGTILPNKPNSLNDFWTAPKQIGANLTSAAADDARGNCGTNCTGYDTCFLVNRAQNGPDDWRDKPVATLASAFSGISVDVYTDQDAFQVYSCNSQNGSLTLKDTQGLHNVTGRPRVVEQYGCVVMEVEDWIDAINQPEWQRSKKQIFGPGDGPYVLQAVYNFSVNANPSS